MDICLCLSADAELDPGVAGEAGVDMDMGRGWRTFCPPARGLRAGFICWHLGHTYSEMQSVRENTQ